MQAKKDQIEAQMAAYKDVTINEATAYAAMKTSLGFTTDQSLLDFIKVQTLGNFNSKNLIAGV